MRMRKLCNHVQMDAGESLVISQSSRVSVVWKHFGLEKDDSTQRKPRNLYAMQAERLPMVEAQRTIFARSIV